MAPSLTAKPSLLFPSCLSRAKNHHLPSIRCSSGSPDSGAGTPPLVRAAVGAVTELLRVLSPRKSRDAVQEGDGGAELVSVSPRSVNDVVAALEADYQRAYFLTGFHLIFSWEENSDLVSYALVGNFALDIYAEDCLFEDPTIKFRGRARYSQNLDLLVPFFDSPSIELENIEKGLRVETRYILATWTLRTYLKLPWRPLIAIRGNTTYDLDEDCKVIRHAESWDISALEAISQILLSAPKRRDS